MLRSLQQHIGRRVRAGLCRVRGHDMAHRTEGPYGVRQRFECRRCGEGIVIDPREREPVEIRRGS